MFVLADNNNIAQQYLSELRDITVQGDRAKFRLNLQRIGEILSYEISKEMSFAEKEIQTPIESTIGKFLEEQPLLICVLRASMPFFQGFLNVFDKADCGFVGAFRQESGDKIEIDFSYQATPDVSGREVILIDPMLATGKSIVKTVNNLLQIGAPKVIHIAGVIAAPEGLDYIAKHIEVPIKLWVAAIDRELNDKSYIVPGLGDAGDLSFGPKL